ncbi:MAG TPA: hypothetical protein VMU94_02940 [Streptosporangiaceae bacterium]|nr:hypothetical protein [Streptosporangiaceae bacterium]
MISAEPGLNRYLRVTPGGLLRTDAAKNRAEENLDGTYLLCGTRVTVPPSAPITVRPSADEGGPFPQDLATGIPQTCRFRKATTAQGGR